MKSDSLQSAPRIRLQARLRPTRKLALTAGILVTLAASSALASIVAVVPDVVLFTPPSVVPGAWESDTEIFAFDERQCVQLQAALKTDRSEIPAGTRVRCHFAHMDPVNNPQLLEGRARFDTPIVGVISSSPLLDASDPVCGVPWVTYPAAGTAPFRGFEATQPNDQYQVSPDGHGIRMLMDVPSHLDQLRVITTCCQTNCGD